MACPYVEYRSESNEATFDVERAYCSRMSAFVEPMRADICNDRYELTHTQHCEIYRSSESETGEGEY